jgi:L-methionine (R)-S-oxide reductase
MRKADLLDELRSQIGVVSDRCRGDLDVLYQSVCDKMMELMGGYRWTAIYMKEKTEFLCRFQCGQRSLPEQIPFGEGNISLAAVRGGIVWERAGDRVEVYAPFYRGHHLTGVLVVVAEAEGAIDDEDVSLICELTSLFEAKMKEHNT